MISIITLLMMEFHIGKSRFQLEMFGELFSLEANYMQDWCAYQSQ